MERRLSTAESRQQGPSSSASAATSPEKSANAPSRKSVSRRPCAFVSPSLDPVLERGKRDKDTVVAPEVPTRRPVGQAILDHEPHRQVHHAMGVLTAGGGEIGEVRVNVRATLRTGMLRIRDHEIARTPQVKIPQVVQRPLGLLVPIGLVPTTRTGLSLGGATGRDDL